MKELAAFLLLLVVAIGGWNQPYKAHYGSLLGHPPAATPAPVAAAAPVPAATPAVVRTAPPATPAPDNSWMRNRSTLDAPLPSADGKGGARHGR